jgi:signal transduction histidine kinase
MRIPRANAATANAWFHGVVATAFCLLLVQPTRSCCAQATPLPRSRLVVALYPEADDGSPGSALVDQGIRSTFASGSREPIDVHNEYLEYVEVPRFPDADYERERVELLRRKYANRKVDLVIAGLSSAFDFAIENRERVFPGAPLVFLGVDEQELQKRRLAPDVVGAPIRMDLAESLDLALRLHPQTEQVFVIVGKSKFDAYWEAEARTVFRKHEGQVKLVYLSGLSLPDLLTQAKGFPHDSIAYYMHVMEDGDGIVRISAEVLSQVAAVSNVPIYSHVDSYVGRGIVGGRVFSFEMAGKRAAEIGLRILQGKAPQEIGIQPAIENQFVFDGRQLKRWGIGEAALPAGSEIRFQEPSLWQVYGWQIAAIVAFCILQTMLIVRLVVQRIRLASAKKESNESRRELQALTGKLFVAQEAERRRIARELHDDFGQTLALLSVEIDLLRRGPLRPHPQAESHIDAMSAQVKQLSSSIHDLSHQLHPLKLEQLGLVAALSSLCKELGSLHGLRVAFVEEDVPGSIPHAAAVCVYRIVQEALRNVVKHSGARHAVVELRGANGELCLRIQDDGRGFDPNSVASQSGLGLVSMRERLRAVQGEIVLAAQPGQGTQIEVRIPLGIDAAKDNYSHNGLAKQEPVAIASV